MPRKKAGPGKNSVDDAKGVDDAAPKHAARDETAVASPRPEKLTPVMRQWDEAKRQYPDAIIFFRLGDFYEMFFDDAVKGSAILGLTLTSRNKGAADEIPMAGVPHHAAHGYIAKLLGAGHKVALCEQMADPSKTKGIVPRDVVRVVTPGLLTRDEDLPAKENNFLVAVAAGEAGVGFGVFDLSTAELSVCELADLSAALCEVHRNAPREILVAGSIEASFRLAVEQSLHAPMLREVEKLTDPDALIASLIETTQDTKAHTPKAREAAAMLLDFAHRCTPRERLPVKRIDAYDAASQLRIDEAALTHLELVRTISGENVGTLLSTIDETVTSPGGRLLRRRLVAPLRDVAEIRRRHEQVEAFVVHARARDELRKVLQRIGDLERLTVRASLHEASPRDLGSIRDSLSVIPDAQRIVDRLPSVSRGRDLFGGALDVLTDLCAKLDAALVESPPHSGKEGGFVRDAFDGVLDEARRAKRSATEGVVARESSLRETTGASTLRVRYNSVFGYYIEVTRSHLAKVPTSFRRKQTVATGERYTTLSLDALADDIEAADQTSLERESAIFDQLIELVVSHRDKILAVARRIAEWDVAAALAEVAHRFDYVRPVVDDSATLAIVEGRHPVVERHVALGRFVPNDTHLDAAKERLWLVTGPNMAGKSTLMRQVALIVVLAQMGSFVPAKSATIGLVDRLLSRVGASDNVARGDSTFMVEMRETAFILENATRKSFVILDEIGRGTSTYDGLAIAWSVAEYLVDAIGCRAMFATHHELTDLTRSRPAVANVSVSAREHEGGIVFLHQLRRGSAQGSFGVGVAKLAGMKSEVVKRATEILEELERSNAHVGAKASDRSQLSLFGQPAAVAPKISRAEKDALDQIAKCDVNQMTPLEALSMIAAIKAKLAT
jgi:DNA mismatch repair protein MutS